MGPASTAATMAARVDPAASSTAWTSSAHDSTLGMAPRGTPSDSAGSPSIEEDHPAEGGEPLEELVPTGREAQELEVAAQAVEVQQIDGTVAHHLIGDICVADRHVTRHRFLAHGTRSAPVVPVTAMSAPRLRRR